MSATCLGLYLGHPEIYYYKNRTKEDEIKIYSLQTNIAPPPPEFLSWLIIY
jgi:hypothetical protein